MKRLLCMATLVLGCSLPAHAQFGGLAGGSLGKVQFQPLPQIPPTVFNATTVSGSRVDFTPSAFLGFDQAILDGKERLAAASVTVAEAAAEYRKTPRPKAKILITQDDFSNPYIEPRK